MVQRFFPARVATALLLAFVVVGGVVAAGAVLRTEDESVAGPAATTTSTSTTTTLPPTTTTTTDPKVIVQPAHVDLPDVPPECFGPGASSPVIQAYEDRLYRVHIDPGGIDGYFDQNLVYAMHAVEKLANLPRTGRLCAGEATALELFLYPAPLHPAAEPNRTEINVTNQIITLYENYQVRQIVTTSTASGESFCYVTPKRAPTQRICEVATTPNGRYTYYFFYEGWHKGDLGSLYNPYYFFKGRAIHGYDDVPPEPASHGCARIPMNVAKYWYTLVHEGDAVYVDGGSNGEQIISSTPI